MITTVILDIGRVTGKFDWEEFIKTLGFDDEINKRIAKATTLSSMWDELDKGVMTDEQLLNAFISNDTEIGEYTKVFFEHIPEMVVEYDYSNQFVLDLKNNGYKVYILSNFGERPFEVFERRSEFLKNVDGKVISYQEKCTKPSPLIYKTLLDRYNINPKEAVFLDDLEANLEAAAEFGISGIQFTGLDNAKKALAEFGVCI